MTSINGEAASSADWLEIIEQLRLEAGRLMEDTMDDLAGPLPTKLAAAVASLHKERETIDDIQSLLSAAHVLHRRCMARNQD